MFYVKVPVDVIRDGQSNTSAQFREVEVGLTDPPKPDDVKKEGTYQMIMELDPMTFQPFCKIVFLDT